MSQNKNFKNANGVYLTRQLFLENQLPDGPKPVYTLKGYDHQYRGQLYPSLRRLFVESDDPTEYSFAITHLDGWEHWKAICSQTWFAPYLADWREELEIKIKSRALQKIQTAANSATKDSLQANKVLLAGGWLEKPSASVGRPTKEKIKREAEKLFDEKNVFDDDFKRVMQ